MKTISITKTTEHPMFNIETNCKITKVFLTFLGIKIYKIREVFLCVKSQWTINREKEHEEWIQEQNQYAIDYVKRRTHEN